MPSAIDVTVQTPGFSTIVSVSGEVELSTRTKFADLVIPVAHAADRLVLDMTEVGFIDSFGIGELVRIRRIVQGRGQALHLVPSRRVEAALTLASVMAVLQTEGETAILEGTQVFVSPVAADLLNETFGTDAVTDELLVGIAKITVNTTSGDDGNFS